MAKSLKGGEILALSGDLGGGKTTFVKGLAKGLGIRALVTSPSFVIVKEYKGRGLSKSLVHVDLYRLKGPEEIESLGLSDYLGKPDKISVIEWAEKIKEILPKKTIWLEFEFVDEKTRKIRIKSLTRGRDLKKILLNKI